VERKRVVVTGMGILCPTGNSIEEAWLNTSRGQSGIDFMKRVDTSRIANHIMGEVKNFDPNEVFGKREARRMDRCMQLGLAAARQAMEDSGLIITDENAYQVACIIGSGVGD
jgi:3-oxoacyl-[acyl-carrier-protein] synthase II